MSCLYTFEAQCGFELTVSGGMSRASVELLLALYISSKACLPYSSERYTHKPQNMLFHLRKQSPVGGYTVPQISHETEYKNEYRVKGLSVQRNMDITSGSFYNKDASAIKLVTTS